MKVLVIEDNLATAKFYTALLNKENIASDYILSGKKAIDTINEMECDSYDMIILDMELPDVSGLKVLEELRGRFTMEQIPVLVVSGIHNEHVIEEVKEAGAHEFITKPFKNLYFKSIIHKLLKTDYVDNNF